MTLPAVLRGPAALFEDFYRSGHSGCVLEWLHGHGMVVLHGFFNAGVKEMIMTAFQAAVCLLLNDAAVLSVEEIRSTLEIPREDVRLAVAALARGRFAVLKLTGVESNLVSFNEEFSTPLRRVHIPTATARAKAREARAVEDCVLEQRKYLVDAQIVRIMKARRRIEHAELIEESMKALSQHFRADVRLVKARLEELIHQEYIRRDPTLVNVYFYVA